MIVYPNASLRAIQDLVTQIDEDPNATNRESELVDHIRNLDRWLSEGGFLPDDWSSSYGVSC